MLATFRQRLTSALMEIKSSPVREIIPWQWYHRIWRPYFVWRGLVYAGDSIECPICERRFRQFLHGKCPRCNLPERHRVIYLYLTRCVPALGDGKRLAHFAPEIAVQERLAKLPRLRYVTLDLDSTMVDLNMDLTHLGLRDRTCDAVVCSHVLEHIEKDRLAMSELLRILTGDGFALILVPLDATREATFEDPANRTPRQRREAYGMSNHVRIYGRDFVTRLSGVGFSVETLECGRAFGEEACRTYGLEASSTFWICRRSEAAV